MGNNWVTFDNFPKTLGPPHDHQKEGVDIIPPYQRANLFIFIFILVCADYILVHGCPETTTTAYQRKKNQFL